MNSNTYCKIKVTNNGSKAVYFHNKVPYEHVEMLKSNPNLSVDVLGQYREYNNDQNSRGKGRNKTSYN